MTEPPADDDDALAATLEGLIDRLEDVLDGQDMTDALAAAHVVLIRIMADYAAVHRNTTWEMLGKFCDITARSLPEAMDEARAQLADRQSRSGAG